MKFWLTLISVLFLSSIFAQSETESDATIKLKSMFIYNFAKYATWPEGSINDEFTLAILGSSDEATRFYDLMFDRYTGKEMQGSTLVIKNFKSIADINGAHLLFITKGYEHKLSEIERQTESFPTLTVANSFPFNSTMINFVQQNNKMMFSINKADLKSKNIELGPVLYKMAVEINSEKEWYSLIDKLEEQLKSNVQSVSKEDLLELIEQYKEKEKQIKEKEEEIKKQNVTLQEQEMILKARKGEVTDVEKKLKIFNEMLDSLNKEVAIQNGIVAEQIKTIKTKEIEIDLKEQELANKEIEIKKKNAIVQQQGLTISNKDQEISGKNKVISQKDEELSQKEKIQILTYLIIVIIIILAIIFYVNYLNKKKSNALIQQKNKDLEKQKKQIEEAHKEITDSITYAKRIQSAILPPDRVVKEYLQNSFILYKPKDVVAGDFYWMEHIDGKILFAAADCTGHGVPGAMVSVVCNNALNRSVREYGISDPGQLLDKTKELVQKEFEKSEEEVKDGMDIALCCLDGNKLTYAGAHNPLWIIRDGEVIETKADKQPIGRFEFGKPFTTHRIDLQKGDTLYVFSDGYADQFGGDKGKKYKTLNMKRFLTSIQDQPMDKQKELIDQEFENWKGSLEQIDDVCVIGVRV